MTRAFPAVRVARVDVRSGSGHDRLDTTWLGAKPVTADLGFGNDTVRAGAGNDSIAGGAGTDDLYGDEGDDDLFGGPGVEVEVQ